ncbi:RDD family protein [Streptomyces sp. SID9913]|uniref:RDD family protein n=1 Tax=Streptomyces sp. SID9913 TaxID=2706117 RepID=UPI0013DAAA94|nr:RDD family protein [Streptomyces sp. SID9913]
MSELVTGEAVALELRPARLPSRALAVLLDLAAAMAVYIGLTILVVAATASLDEAAQTAISLSLFLLTLVGGPILIETLTHGKSLGKLACGLRVVRDDGGPIRFRHSLVRGLIGVIEILMTLGVVACIASLVSARGRRLGDVFAGTLVVRERVPAGRSGYVPPPPPWLAGRFQGLDLSAVPDGLWLAVRQYLTRMGQLDPQVGSAMAQRLASDLADRTGTPVPPGVHPAAYLAAVLQERQAREARRAFGNGAAAGGRPGGMAAGPTGPYGPPAPAQGPYGQPGYPAAASAPAAPSPTPPTPPPATSPSPSPTPPPSATPPAPSSPEPKDRPSAGGSRGGFVPPA